MLSSYYRSSECNYKNENESLVYSPSHVAWICPSSSISSLPVIPDTDLPGSHYVILPSIISVYPCLFSLANCQLLRSILAFPSRDVPYLFSLPAIPLLRSFLASCDVPKECWLSASDAKNQSSLYDSLLLNVFITHIFLINWISPQSGSV